MPVRTNLDVLLQQIIYSTMQEDSISSTRAPFMDTEIVLCSSPCSSSVSPSSSDPIVQDALLFHSDDESCSDEAGSALSSPAWTPKHASSCQRTSQQYGLTTQRLNLHQQQCSSSGIAERSYYSTGTLNPKVRVALQQLLRRVGSVSVSVSDASSATASSSSPSSRCEITAACTTPRGSDDGSVATSSCTDASEMEDDLMTLPIFLKLRPIRTRVPEEAATSKPHAAASRPPTFVNVPRCSMYEAHVRCMPASHILSQPAALARPQPAAGGATSAPAASTNSRWLRGGGK